jgi:MFS family permease
MRSGFSLRVVMARISKMAAQFSAGGSWTDLLPQISRRNLRWFWFDGLFASASEAAIQTYQSLYILALGATNAQIGLLSALSSLSAVLVLMPGALMSERLGKRKEIALISGGILGRLVLFLIMLVPFFFMGSTAVYVAIGLTILRDTLNNVGMPAWVSLSADLVPITWRGRYFGSRNFIMALAGMSATLIFGEIITRSGQIQGYQAAYLIAFIIGMISTFSFSRIKEPPPAISAQPAAAFSWRAIPSYFRSSPAFLAFCLTSALWNFSLNISGPFFAPYQVKVLGATATMVGILMIVSQISSMLTQQPFGHLTDKWGARRVVVVTSLLIPFLPFAWLFITEAWQAIPVNLIGGALWAGYSLAAFAFLLELTPEDQRARFTALYQIVIALSLSLGAVAGGLVVSRFGYLAVFACSAVGRMLAALLFVRFVRPSGVKSVTDGNA